MPLATTIWLGIPFLLGLLVIGSCSAQRNLIDLFIEGAGERRWVALFLQAWVPITLFIGYAVLRVVLGSLQNLADSRLRARASQFIQSEVHKSAVQVPLARMDQADYYDRLQRAQLAAGTDLLGILQHIIDILRLLFELVGLLTFVWMSAPLVSGILAVVFMFSFLIRLESDLVKRRLNRELTRPGRESDYLRDMIIRPNTIRDMRLSGSMDYLIHKWSEGMKESLSMRMNANRSEIRRGILASSLQICGLFGGITWLVLSLKSGGISAGAVVVIIQAMRQAYAISSRMAFPIGKIYIQSMKIIDLVDFLQENKQACESESKKLKLKVPGSEGAVTFENVSYQYDGAEEAVLQQLSFTLKPGETVALVGENGAGKSTLVKLLLGLYRPTKGRITWDGVDLTELDPVLLRRRMSAAFQDFIRYETSLRDNIAFGLPDEILNETRLLEALRNGGAAELAVLVGGLDARVGQLSGGGRELSGGQWQRLAIARAALRDAQLLVLDEPTAAIDPQHETDLYQSLRDIAQGRTVLFVSHRLGWARFSDRILVLRDGVLAEEGSHDTLLAANGVYAAMFRTQAEWYREDNLLSTS
ncbi:ABC transporter ATP-binding protein [Paenibacillus solisilvae]|uniref:ABC transporter ATP-binding protein n=1 Tax=Paenibacillus solisilvae TaxID=2486751 RepID=A0ABW0VWN0_9BACL